MNFLFHITLILLLLFIWSCKHFIFEIRGIGGYENNWDMRTGNNWDMRNGNNWGMRNGNKWDSKNGADT